MLRRTFLGGAAWMLLPQGLLLGAELHEHETVLAMAKACNDYRRRCGRSPVEIHPALTRAAVMHCRNMAKHRNMSHYLGGSPSSRAARYGWRRGCSENIAMGQRTVASVTQTWINSGGHRANMLGGHRYGGFGLAYAGSTPYWCQMFG